MMEIWKEKDKSKKKQEIDATVTGEIPLASNACRTVT